MNQVAEPNFIENPNLIDSLITDKLNDLAATHQRSKEFYQANRDEFKRVLRDFPLRQDRYTLSADVSDLELRFTGDKATLGLVFAHMRSRGYSPDSRPKEGDTTWSTFWRSPTNDAKLWVSFSSDQCKRVQVGTKTVEQPVYEIQCGEVFDALPAEPLEDSNHPDYIPF